MQSSAATRARDDSVSVLSALDVLLDEGDKPGVRALFSKLIDTYNRQLREALLKKIAAAKNEGVSSEQLAFLFTQLLETTTAGISETDAKLKAAAQSDASPEAKPAQKPQRQPPRRREIPAHLPVVANLLPVPEAERACELCGGERVCIGHDTTRIIDIEPARVIVREDRREKLACKNCPSEIVRAPIGDKVVAGGGYGSRLVAELLVSKYADGLPLERQRERIGRLGYDMPSSTIGEQITWATDLLGPVARGLLDAVLDADNLHLDATSLPVLDRDTPNGIKLGALWGYVGVNIDSTTGAETAIAAYLYNSTAKKNGQRQGELGPEEVLALRRRRGKKNVVADASGLFDASFAIPGLEEIGCNMHGRRYFQKALDAGDLRAALPIAAYKKLYDIEETIRGKPPADKLATRQRASLPVYRELLSWCDVYRANEPPKSQLGAALGYIHNHAVALGRFLHDGTLPIDNGIVERLHRRPAMGRRSFLFAGSDTGAERAAIAYAVLGTCRLLEINPFDYLCDVLPKLARGISIKNDLPALMPAAWALAPP